jgi:hypothetical protein
MVKRVTMAELRVRYGRPKLSEMTTAEKTAHLAETLAKHRETLERQGRLLAELQRRMDPNAPKPPKLGLKTLAEVVAYVDRIADGSDSGKL